jgi:hypothetical protein
VEDSFVFPQGMTMKGAAVVNLLLTTLQTVNLLTPATPSVTLAGRYLSTRLHSERTRAHHPTSSFLTRRQLLLLLELSSPAASSGSTSVSVGHWEVE